MWLNVLYLEVILHLLRGCPRLEHRGGHVWRLVLFNDECKALSGYECAREREREKENYTKKHVLAELKA